MAVSEERVRQLAVLAVGRDPSFTAQGAVRYATKPPASSTQMQSLVLTRAAGQYAVVCPVEVLLRENASYRTACGTINLFDATTTYTVTVNGDAFSDSAGATIEATIDNLVTAFAAGATGSGTETMTGRSRVEFGTIDAATTYTVTLDAIAFGVTGHATQAALAAALLALIQAHGISDKLTPSVDANNDLVIDNASGQSYTIAETTTGGTGTADLKLHHVTATRESEGDASVLKLVGTGSADYTVVLSAATGTGRWQPLEADATEVTFEVWGLARGRTVPAMLQGQVYTVDHNWSERIAVAGLTHLAAVITVTDGVVTRAIGPCDLEE